MQINRITRLNQEMANRMEKSKLILSTPTSSPDN